MSQGKRKIKRRKLPKPQVLVRLKEGSQKKIKRRRSARRYKSKIFNRTNRKLIFEGLEKGVDIKRVLALLNINKRTFDTWMKRGKDPTNPPTYSYFRSRINRIEHDNEKEAIAAIRRAYKGGTTIYETKIKQTRAGTLIEKVEKTQAPQWQAAAWRLERKYPDDYGAKDKSIFGDKSVEEIAREVKQAADILFASVPSAPTQEQIPEDMPT